MRNTSIGLRNKEGKFEQNKVKNNPVIDIKEAHKSIQNNSNPYLGMVIVILLLSSWISLSTMGGFLLIKEVIICSIILMILLFFRAFDRNGITEI